MTAAAVPGIAAQLEAVYGTGYAGFATLDQVDKIMAARTRRFVGRDDQLAALDAFVASNPCGVTGGRVRPPEAPPSPTTSSARRPGARLSPPMRSKDC